MIYISLPGIGRFGGASGFEASEPTEADLFWRRYRAKSCSFAPVVRNMEMDLGRTFRPGREAANECSCDRLASALVADQHLG